MSAQGASLQPENRLRAARDAAVIDVGSNSVRLVLYRLEGRAIWTVYNEKVLAGLGRDLGSTGRLSPAGMDTAMTALRRFRAVLDAAAPDAIFTAATAAVREATDGLDFVGRVQAETGLTLRVLSGQEEARYAALGVLAGSPHGEGVVGDLGGASLELVRLSPEGPVEGATLGLGPFALAGVRPDKVRDEIERRLAPHAGRFRAQAFQAVGGAWRNLALLHMRMSGYPLQIVHQYEMSRTDALDAARFLSRQSKASLERIEGVSRKRLETLPHAAMVLEALIEQLGIERIAVSAYGLREGLLFESMPPETQGLDPLIEGCAALTGRQGVDETLGPTLEAWLAPVFGDLPPVFEGRDHLLQAAACRLADLGARLHPDHRADLVFEQVLRAPVAGQTHAERAFLAVAAFARHTSASSIPEGATLSRLLSERQMRRDSLGAAIRLGCDLSGRSSVLLTQSRLGLKDDRLILAAADGWSDMLLGEQTARRATQLAGVLGVKLEIRRGVSAPAFSDPAVEAVFAAYPPALRAALLDLRTLIFETATGPLSESLKWGQPAYRPVGTKAGTTVRIDALKGSTDGYALYFHCQTTLGASFRDLYSDTLRFEGDRAILLSLAKAPPREVLAFCIVQALTYRGRRLRPNR